MCLISTPMMTTGVKVQMTCPESANTMKKTSVRDKAPPLPDPEKDGVDHLNVHYNFARQPLGRRLSTYQVERFEHDYFGAFKCIEGFRLYVKTGCCDDEFRNQTGAQAKAYFRQRLDAGTLTQRDIPNEEQVLLLAYYARLVQHPVTAAQFTESTLPFDNYFLWGRSKLPIRPPKESALLVQTLTTLRQLMQQGLTPTPLTDEEYAKLIVRN